MKYKELKQKIYDNFWTCLVISILVGIGFFTFLITRGIIINFLSLAISLTGGFFASLTTMNVFYMIAKF